VLNLFVNQPSVRPGSAVTFRAHDLGTCREHQTCIPDSISTLQTVCRLALWLPARDREGERYHIKSFTFISHHSLRDMA
jgi:hypothetical protein